MRMRGLVAVTSEKRGCLAMLFSWFGGGQQAMGNQSSVLRNSEAVNEETLPYRARDNFLSEAELTFYHALRFVIGERVVVCPKVRLIDIFFIVNRQDNYSYQGKISQKHIDFLLCDPRTLRPLCGLELDDSSHRRRDRQERDEFVNKVFATAGLPLLRIPVQTGYDRTELHEQITPHLPGAAEQPAKVSKASAPAAVPPTCPKCSVPMVVRTVRQGPHAGKQFYGCTNYPQCRQMLQISG